ncbi:T9SS type A sorting domain-containing protein [Dyadobacter diqingensis]|uniref:T9SS type A sorting domain-containing protein n=1 Tax=Dyadobacter diqingensis TaxID=2938121 RepID=UPI0020C18F72|nr:T9SS type A sorting domain-containing protein [Dyadobacter diqingensis]
MKKIISYFTLVLGILAFQFSYAQDVSINIQTQDPSIPIGTSTTVLVTICNEDPSPIDAPTNKLRPQISVSPNATITGATNVDGSPLTGWNVVSTTTGNANSIRLVNTTVLLNGDCQQFRVTILGTVISGPTNFNGSLGFVGPQTPGNNPANDNSSTSVAVTAAPPVATNDLISTPNNTPILIPVPGNDIPGGAALVPGSVLITDPADGTPKTTVTIPGEGTYVVNTSTGEVTFTPVSTFTGLTTPVLYTITDANGLTSNTATITVDVGVLPVTLVSFNVVKEGKVAILNWATTAETNSDHFEIQHSVSGKEWNKIGTVASNGESSVRQNYNFTDKNPVNGENLYRLKMIDKDQTYAYSRIQSVKFDGLKIQSVSIYPNPSADRLFIKDADLAQLKQASILDMTGRAIFSTNKVDADGINVSKLPLGTYVLHITNLNGTSSSHKIVIVR